MTFLAILVEKQPHFIIIGRGFQLHVQMCTLHDNYYSIAHKFKIIQTLQCAAKNCAILIFVKSTLHLNCELN